MTRGARLFVISGLLVAVALAFFVSPWADSDPDGLERAAIKSGFAEDARDHDLAGGPVADYSVKGIDNDRIATGAAGLIGVLAVFGMGVAIFSVIGKRSASKEDAP
jgi:F0F1-type ATP synthase assembly protein I